MSSGLKDMDAKPYYRIDSKSDASPSQDIEDKTAFIDSAVNEERYYKAYIYILSGIHGRETPLDFSPISRKYYKTRHLPQVQVAIFVIALAHLLLVLFEPISRPPLLNIPYQVLLTFELCFLIIHSLEVYSCYRTLGFEKSIKSSWNKAKIACIVIVFVDIIVCLATQGQVIRFSRPLRPFFAIDRFRNIRKIVVAISAAVPKVFFSVILIMSHITLFAFVGHTLLDSSFAFPSIACNSTTQYTYQVSPYNPSSTACHDYFNQFWEGFMNLFVLLTTANFPDVMLPYIQTSLFPAIFFCVFIVMGIYLIKNITLAGVYVGYSESAKELIEKKEKYRIDMYNEAFDVLYTDFAGFISLSQWRSLLSMARPDLPLQIIDAFFKWNALPSDKEGDELLMDRNGFLSSLELVEVKAQKMDVRKEEVRSDPKKFKTLFRTISKNNFTRLFMDLIIIISCVICISTANNTDIDPFSFEFYGVNVIILLLFSFELLIHLLSVEDMQWIKAKPIWLLDAFTVINGWALIILLSFPLSPTFLSRIPFWFAVLRILQCVRLLRHLSMNLRSLFQIFPILSRFAYVGVVFLYFFCVIAMELFGGKLNKGDKGVDESAYGILGYYPLNFNSLGKK